MQGDLTLPAPGSTTARAVFSAALRRALADLLRLRPAAGAVGAAWQRFLPALRTLAEREPGALASAARQPTIGALIRCLRARPDAALQAELLATLALDLALAGALRDAVRVPDPPARVVCLPARRVLTPPPGHALTIDPEGWSAGPARGGLAALAGEGPEEHVLKDGFAALPGALALALRCDNNPLAALEAHPDKQGSGLDLGGQPPARWVATLTAALAEIAAHLPALRAEIDAGLLLIVPVGYDEERHLSASYQEAIGAIYLSLHPQPRTLAEAILHEFSHNKLHALLEQGPLLENAWSPLYASPVRPDPRPLHGVLLAAHAFFPVARLYEALLAAGDEPPAPLRARLRAVAAGNHAAVETLQAHARPTALGRPLLAELARLDLHFEPWWRGQAAP